MSDTTCQTHILEEHSDSSDDEIILNLNNSAIESGGRESQPPQRYSLDVVVIKRHCQ